MVQSMYAPGTDEGCTALGSESCPYLSNPLKSLFTSQTQVQIDNCAATVLPKATSDQANYIYVALPSAAGAGGVDVNLSSPKATWYKCDHLHQ